MASVMNAVLLQASLEKIGVETRVQTSLRMQDVAEPYIRQRAMRHLEKGRVVIFGGFGASMGSPLFTTDTAAALRASEINADVVLKGAAGDSVYGCPPGSNSNAAFEHISYRELVARGFNAMDVTAITFCEENNVPEPGNISKALCGDQVGTLVDQLGRIGWLNGNNSCGRASKHGWSYSMWVFWMEMSSSNGRILCYNFSAVCAACSTQCILVENFVNGRSIYLVVSVYNLLCKLSEAGWKCQVLTEGFCAITSPQSAPLVLHNVFWWKIL